MENIYEVGKNRQMYMNVGNARHVSKLVSFHADYIYSSIFLGVIKN
jgi:hypothetical protein